MTDINKISEITGLSVRTLRKIEKAGFLKSTKSADPITDAARVMFKKGQKLSALQQFHLWRNPDARKALEPYSWDIRQLMERLGNVEPDAAPWGLAVKIALAARKDPDAIAELARWIAALLNRQPGAVDHAFICVRLLVNVPDHQIEPIAGHLRSAIFRARSHPTLRGFWHVGADGVTIYKKPLDL